MSIYSKVFARFYDKLIYGFESKIAVERRRFLNGLVGEIIDVGSGTGANFSFFNPNTKVYAVEPSIEMMERSKEKIQEKNIELLNFGINDDALQLKFTEKSVDAIICTLVLCTISEPEVAIQNFKKWLKPEGKLIIIEHVHSSNMFYAWFQNLINPVWKKIGEGCNLNRNTEKLLLENGFVSNNNSVISIGLSVLKGVYTIQ